MRNQEIIERFAAGKTRGKRGHLFIEGDRIYSYGRHFTLAVRGDWGAGISYLINGDKYGSTTAQHTSSCISALTPNVQIPFSALEAAGVPVDLRHGQAPGDEPMRAIRLLDVREDARHTVCRVCRRDVSFIGGGLPIDEADRWPPALCFRHAHDASPLCPPPPDVPAKWDPVAEEHTLGATLLTHRGRRQSAAGSDTRTLLSSMDENEPWRLRAYFMCEVPDSPQTIDQAYRALTPIPVRQAQEAGLHVRRQGDIFGIPLEGVQTRRVIGVSTRMAPAVDTTPESTHRVTERRDVLGRGVLYHKPPFRQPQHARVALGRTWHRLIKNTALASWNAKGYVD